LFLQIAIEYGIGYEVEYDCIATTYPQTNKQNDKKNTTTTTTITTTTLDKKELLTLSEDPC